MSGARVVYVITSYKLPEQVLRLVSRLRQGSPAAALVLHHDDRGCEVDRGLMRGLGVQLLEPPSVVNWGEASQLEMVLRCLRFCLEKVEFSWLVLLSGQDYPIRPLAHLEAALAGETCDALVQTHPCARPHWLGPVDEFAGRYHFRWRRSRSRTLALLAHAGARRGVRGVLLRTRELPSGDWIATRSLHSPFGPRLVCHVGSDWYSLSHVAVEAIDEFIRARPEVLRYYRRTLIPTESFVQTIVANDRALRVSGETRRYTAWGEDPHLTGPQILRLGDLDAILSSGCDFARKFDPTVDSAVLDEIDRRVHSAHAR